MPILCNAHYLLLEPDQSILHQLGVDMESILLNIDKDSCVNVPVCNYNMNAQHFSKGQIVGRLYPVTLTNFDSDVRYSPRSSLQKNLCDVSFLEKF